MNHNRLILPIFIFFLFVSFVSAAAPTTTDGDYPWIRFDEIGDHYVGEQFTISGTTNLPVDESFIFETVSSSYKPGVSDSGEFTGQSEIVKVVKGDTNNKWSIDVDASTFKPDEYVATVEAVSTDSTATTVYNLLDKGGTAATATTTKTASKTATTTAPPTTVATTVATTVTTTAATTIPQAPPATTAAAPGFGVLVSLIALGTAAVLFLRKE